MVFFGFLWTAASFARVLSLRIKFNTHTFLSNSSFNLVGYGCMTCIGNSGPLPEEVVGAIEKGDLVAVGVLSGNRNFEGRINPHTRANYLASPPLCIAYAIAGKVSIDFETEPIGIVASYPSLINGGGSTLIRARVRGLGYTYMYDQILGYDLMFQFTL